MCVCVGGGCFKDLMVCVCVCVHVSESEREKERERELGGDVPADLSVKM